MAYRTLEHLEPSATRRKAKRTETQLPRFHVFDGASRVVIEAQSEEDAFYLCTEMGWLPCRQCRDQPGVS